MKTSKVTTASRSRSSRRERASSVILGAHPSPPHPLGMILSANDQMTSTNVPHRVLSEKESGCATVNCLRDMLLRHHASPEAIERTRQHHEAMKRLGLEAEQVRLRRFPTNPTTRKGNLAEVVLAEYIVAACGTHLPVYRLRYNPNVDQSMKGDDVLAFDLDSDPVRIVVGEAKFRGASSTAAVREIVEELVHSYNGGIPASLQFVADRLFEEGKTELGKRVFDCAQLFVLGRLRIDYVGMLLSDERAHDRVHHATPNSLHRLAMISLGVPDPDTLVDDCYKELK